MKFGLSQTNRRILLGASLVAATVFYFQTIRPIREQRKRLEQQEIAEIVYKARYPDLVKTQNQD